MIPLASGYAPSLISRIAQRFGLSMAVFLFVAVLLGVVQLKTAERPMLMLERFVSGAGWIQVLLMALYGGFIASRMKNPLRAPLWRTRTWTLFSVVFFSQLFLGLLGAEQFLMTGKLHLPIPAMILSGPLYREQLSVMTLLFLSTVLLTGPAWCSHLCYFGALDQMAARGRGIRGVLKHKKALKAGFFFLVVVGTLLLRWFRVPALTATVAAAGFGIVGLLVMVWFSRRSGRMIHCTLYCPIGSLVNILSPVNPFRMYLDTSCTLCMKCTRACRYDALNEKDVRAGKPSYSCTLCGDCLAACPHDSIKYQFLKLSPEASRNLYLFLTISFHAVFLALARI